MPPAGRRGFTGGAPHYVDQLVVDEADRLSPPALEHLRDRFDRRPVGLLLIGTPGIDKRLSGYPQLYSRIGFAHQYRPLGDQNKELVPPGLRWQPGDLPPRTIASPPPGRQRPTSVPGPGADRAI